MMMVDTELRSSAIHGIGVFLLEPVRKGDLIWQFDSRVDRIYAEAEIATLPDRMQRFLRIYSTWHAATGVWVLCGDNGRHFNHSDTPNTVSDGIAFGHDHAALDMAADTELTSDYNQICDYVRRNGGAF